MDTRQMILKEFESRIYDMEKEASRRREMLNYLIQNDSPYEYIVCAFSWLDHTTKTTDEIIEILEEGE